MRWKGVNVKHILIAILVVTVLAGTAWAKDRRQLSESEKQWLRTEARIMARNTRRLRLPQPTHVRRPLGRQSRHRYLMGNNPTSLEGKRRHLEHIYNGLIGAQFHPAP